MAQLPDPKQAVSPDIATRARLPFWRSLGGRLQVVCLSVLLVFAAVEGWSTNRLIREALRHTITQQISQISLLLNLAISPYTAEGRQDLLRDYLGESIGAAESGSGLLYLVVLDSAGKPIVKVGALPAGDWPQPSSDYAAAAASGVVHVRQGILLAENSVGEVRYGLSASAFQRLLGAMVNSGIALLLSTLCLAGLAYWLIGAALARRLRRLVHAAGRLAEGDYGERVQERGGDELGLLASSFNTMAAAIGERIEALQRAQSEVRELNETLEARVVRRTTELAQRNRELGETIADLEQTRAKLLRSERLAGLGKVVVGVAHELNTPIGNAKVIASALEEETREMRGSIEGPGIKRSILLNYFQTAEESTRSMLGNLDRAAALVGSFRESAAMQQGERPRRFDLVELLRDAAALARLRAGRQDIECELVSHGPCEIRNYYLLVERVLLNCIENCYVHAFGEDSGGRIRLVLEDEGERVRIEISDNGRGIDPLALEHVFDPFYTTALGRGSSGLGLNAVYNIVTGVLGGEVTVDSTTGNGTRMQIRFPKDASK